MNRTYFLALLPLAACAPEQPETLRVATSSIATMNFTPPPCPRGGGSYSCGGREGALPPELQDACVDERWIGYYLDPMGTKFKCPAAYSATIGGQWVVSPLFTSNWAGEHPEELERFCKYEWVESTFNPGPPVISALPNRPNMRLERDCRVVAPQFLPTQSASATLLRNAYRAQLNHADFPASTQIPGNHAVRIAIIDSSPDGSPVVPPQGASDHGMIVSSIAHDANCIYDNGSELDCAADVLTYQALKLDGGTHGYPSDVAEAIDRALHDRKLNAPAARLVINMSIGWHDKYSGLHGPEMRTTGLAAWLSVQHAACLDALVVAAAGNRAQVTNELGPLFPGGWEQEQALCGDGSGSAYRPALYAIGAVSGTDEALGVARDGGTPRIVGPGAFSVVDTYASNLIGSPPTLARSGTSVSAAAFSGLAALVWRYDPTLEYRDIADLIFNNGVLLPELADFQGASTITFDRRRIDICNTIHAVCAGAVCPATCPARPAGASASVDMSAVIDIEFPGLLSGPLTPSTLTNLPIVPRIDQNIERPWVGPQPGKPACPACMGWQSMFSGKIEYDSATEDLDTMVLRMTPCQPAWCDPTMGGIKIEVENPDEEFVVDLGSEFNFDFVDSAVLETSFVVGNETIVTASEVAVEEF
ncbi:MAG: S8/S53 family peptidase [Deltaproteobacteria bacterium]